MALSITVNGGGTFSASMEEGPVSFTATLGAVPGPKGDTGATGPAGQNSVIAATAPIEYDSGTQTVSIQGEPEFVSVRATEATTTWLLSIGIRFPDLTEQTTAFVGEARKEYIIARNNTGSTIAKGKVVYLSGATGNKPTMALAQANSEATSARTIGILIEETANNGDGKVIISGAAENIDTSAFSAGQTVYLSSSVAGGLQTTLPAAPLHGVVIGIVTRANPSVGSIEVAIQNYQELSELSDVNVSDKANNDGLFWEASSSTWRSKTIAEVLGYTPSSLTLSSFSASAPISYNSGTGAFTFDSSGFLLKADNLSGLASASTARTNLGLGTMATETAANYAPLASPAFTGNPTAPTPATSDNDTSIATTAFVNAYAPAASTTTAGKVELATDSEVIAGTSATLAVTPKGYSEAIIARNWHIHYAGDFIANTSGTGGTNATFQSSIGRFVYGPSSTGAGHVSAAQYHPPRVGGLNNASFDWSKPFWFSFKAARISGTSTNSTFRCIAGALDTVYGDPTNRCIGVRQSGANNAELIVHNGTTLTAVSSSHLFGGSVSEIEIYSDGAGNVTMYANGSSVATTNAGPTAVESVSAARQVQMQVTNNSSFTSGQLQFLVWMPITKTQD